MLTKTEIKLYDKSEMFGVLANFSSQLEDALDIGSSLSPPDKLKNINKIIITGLGGSAVGGDLVRSFLQYEIDIPVFINRNYGLPAFADGDTLLIASSYSGETEETISAYEDGKSKGCKIAVISTGGRLTIMAEGDGNYVIKIPKGFQPRCALGYSVVPLLILFAKLGLISDKDSDIKEVIRLIKERSSEYTTVDPQNNLSIRMAERILGRIPVIYSSCDIMDVVNLRWRGQFNENSKSPAFGNVLPEMNHNEIVGWGKNLEILRKFVPIYLKDKDDNPKILKRMEVTKDIIKPYRELEFELESEAPGRLERIFDLIYLGDWVSYYLAILYKSDPTQIENINILKSKLADI